MTVLADVIRAVDAPAGAIRTVGAPEEAIRSVGAPGRVRRSVDAREEPVSVSSARVPAPESGAIVSVGYCAVAQPLPGVAYRVPERRHPDVDYYEIETFETPAPEGLFARLFPGN